MKVFYEWGKRVLRRIELFTQEDMEKKPEIPQASSAAQRLKDASDTAETKRSKSKWKRLRNF